MSENVKPFNISAYKIYATMTCNNIHVFVTEFDTQYQVVCVDAYNNIYNDVALFDAAHEAILVAACHIAHEHYLTEQLEFNVDKVAEFICDKLPSDDELLTAI